MGPYGPVVGRDEEVRLIGELLAAGNSVVLAGEAGVGKTRLAREVLAARGIDSDTPWVAATESSRVLPFGAFAAVLPRAIDAASGSNAVAVAHAVRDAVLAEATRGVLVVDDAHLLDDASATIVHYLAAEARLCVVVILRSGEPAPAAITSLWKDERATRVDLEPLAREETDRLVTAMLGGPSTPSTRERLWDASAGNPLYLRELLAAGRADGTLTEVDGVWRFAGDLAVSRRLMELVDAHVRRLGESATAVLELVSVADPLPFGVLEHLAGLEAIAEAEDAGLVEITKTAGRALARVAHPMYGEVVRRGMSHARQVMTHRALADALAARGLRRRDDVLRWTTWRLRGEAPPDVDTLVAAAGFAATSLDVALGEQLARAAVAAEPNSHPARLALADALYRGARYAEALDVLDDDVAEGDRSRTECAVARAKALWGRGRRDEAEAHVVAVAHEVDDPSCIAWLQAYRAMLRLAAGYPAEAIAIAEPLAHSTDIGPRAVLSALSALSLAFAFAGRTADAVAAVDRGRDPELRAAAESFTPLSWAEPAVWTATWLSGDVRGAEALAGAFRVAGFRSRNDEYVSAGSMGLGWAAVERGDVAAAVDLFNDAVAVTAADDRIGVATAAWSGRALAEVARGEARLAEACLDAAVERARSSARWFDPYIEIGRSGVLALDGRRAEAASALEATATDCIERGFLPYAVRATHAIVRNAAPRPTPPGTAERLRDLSRQVDGQYAEISADHAEALDGADGPALEAVADAFAEHGMMLVAAEAASAAAVHYDANGDRAACERAVARAERLAAQCPGAAHSPVASQRVAARLTEREREIATLAASGRTSRDIADALFLSVRTVDSHLAHVYTKLGVDGRRGLAAALGRGAPDA